MSLHLRILLLIAAVNVGVLILVVWLGLKTADSAPVGPQALVEAWNVAENPEFDESRWRAVRGVIRLRPNGKSDFRWPKGADEERDEEIARLRRLRKAGFTGFELTRAGLTHVSPSREVEWPAFYVAFNDRAHWEALATLRNIYIVLCVGTLLLVMATYLVLRRLVLKPLDALVAASRDVAEGRQPAPVGVPRGQDEMANLVHTFNGMAREVNEYQQHLEERVLGALSRARTAENRLVVAQRLAATGTLAAGFAHEINNPLGGTLNALRKLKAGGLSDERREEYFELALDSLHRIRTIVERILNFTPRQREPADVDVADVCQRAASLAGHRAERRGITVVVEADRPVPGVVGDAQELTQAVLNLILNAIDAVSTGTGGTVRVSARTEDGEAVLEVQDDGVGMDAETARRCVDLFYSTKEEGEGTGLGLAIVQHIVTDHGGALDIETKPGRGTTVRIRFPVG